MNSDAFLIYWSQEDVDTMTQGRVHNVNEVGMTQRQRRRHDATSEGVTWQTSKAASWSSTMLWRDVDDRVVMDWRRLRSDFMANPAKIFITIWFESYIVVSQAFLTLDKDLDLNSMFLKVEK
jgi:hypothetical protein